MEKQRENLSAKSKAGDSASVKKACRSYTSVGLKSLVLPDFSVHSLNKLLWAQTLVGPQALSKVSGCRGQCLDGDSHGKQKLERTQRAVAGM